MFRRNGVRGTRCKARFVGVLWGVRENVSQEIRYGATLSGVACARAQTSLFWFGTCFINTHLDVGIWLSVGSFAPARWVGHPQRGSHRPFPGLLSALRRQWLFAGPLLTGQPPGLDAPGQRHRRAEDLSPGTLAQTGLQPADIVMFGWMGGCFWFGWVSVPPLRTGQCGIRVASRAGWAGVAPEGSPPRELLLDVCCAASFASPANAGSWVTLVHGRGSLLHLTRQCRIMGYSGPRLR